mgnify:CR=1 FL=1
MKDPDQIQQKNQFPDSTIDSLFNYFGFTTLTEIQKKASPIILQKRDCLVIAPTGSGKTECSIIPIFSLVKKSKKLGKIKVLYITPLRALKFFQVFLIFLRRGLFYDCHQTKHPFLP